jgi:hypothetical protein
MRLKVFTFFCVVLMTSLVFAQKDNQKYVTPTKEDVGVYKNQVRELYEKPLFTVGKNDKLVILETSKQNYKIQKSTGESGWIEKRLVITTGRSRTFVFDDADVIGYLDNPTPVYIIDADNPNADPIKLDRSFADALRDNTDKETIERQTK